MRLALGTEGTGCAEGHATGSRLEGGGIFEAAGRVARLAGEWKMW
jgi:hypothetical protein